jgi:hypothetical protein
VPVLVAPDHAPVGQHDLSREQLVGRQSVAPAEDADPASEHQTRDAHRRSAAAGDRPSLRVQRVVELAEPGAGPDRHGVAGDRDRAQTAEVDESAGGRGRPGEAMTTRADRDAGARAACERQHLGDVLGRSAAHDRLRPELPETRHRRPAQPLVPRRPLKHDLTRDRIVERRPVRCRRGRAHRGGSSHRRPGVALQQDPLRVDT